MGIFDQIKDALTTDDAERAEQAKQEAAKADKARSGHPGGHRALPRRAQGLRRQAGRRCC
jgi:hypothetical protein